MKKLMLFSFLCLFASWARGQTVQFTNTLPCDVNAMFVAIDPATCNTIDNDRNGPLLIPGTPPGIPPAPPASYGVVWSSTLTSGYILAADVYYTWCPGAPSMRVGGGGTCPFGPTMPVLAACICPSGLVDFPTSVYGPAMTWTVPINIHP